MWGLKGERLLCPVSPQYKNFYVYSSVSPLCGESFMLFLPWVNTEMMSLYLEQMSQAFSDSRLLLVPDQAGWHKAKDLLLPKNISFEFLPSYSPDLNPVEKLWLHLRRHVCRNRLFESEQELEQALESALASLSRDSLKTLCRCSYLEYIN